MARNVGVKVESISIASGGTAEAFASSALPVNKFTLNAAVGNTSTVFVGDSSVSATNYMWALTAGDGIAVDMGDTPKGDKIKLDLQHLYGLSATTGDDVSLGHFNI